MKKLIIAAAAIAMGFVANAAYVNWSVSGTQATEGYTVLLFASQPATKYDSVAALKAASIGEGTIAKSGRNYSTGTVKTSGDAVTSTASFYYAILSGDSATTYNFVAATGMGGSVYDPPASGSTYTALNAAAIQGGTQGTIGKEEPTPEPTSGLLLLLGVAGLALKRKQK